MFYTIFSGCILVFYLPSFCIPIFGICVPIYGRFVPNIGMYPKIEYLTTVPPLISLFCDLYCYKSYKCSDFIVVELICIWACTQLIVPLPLHPFFHWMLRGNECSKMSSVGQTVRRQSKNRLIKKMEVGRAMSLYGNPVWKISIHYARCCPMLMRQIRSTRNKIRFFGLFFSTSLFCWSFWPVWLSSWPFFGLFHQSHEQRFTCVPRIPLLWCTKFGTFYIMPDTPLPRKKNHLYIHSTLPDYTCSK